MKKDWLKLAKEIHPTYDYSKAVYKNIDVKICISCPIHGDFWQTPYHNVNRKQGCPDCKWKKMAKTQSLSKEEFINKSNIVHENKYDYSLVNYINAHEKVIIICQKHGEFYVTPNNHIYGIKGKGGKIGCVSCSNNTSYAANKWLDSFNNADIKREVAIKVNNKLYKFDGFNEKTNTVYEFFGSFWHR